MKPLRTTRAQPRKMSKGAKRWLIGGATAGILTLGTLGAVKMAPLIKESRFNHNAQSLTEQANRHRQVVANKVEAEQQAELRAQLGKPLTSAQRRNVLFKYFKVRSGQEASALHTNTVVKVESAIVKAFEKQRKNVNEKEIGGGLTALQEYLDRPKIKTAWFNNSTGKYDLQFKGNPGQMFSELNFIHDEGQRARITDILLETSHTMKAPEKKLLLDVLGVTLLDELRNVRQKGIAPKGASKWRTHAEKLPRNGQRRF
ncbi:Uncharacterised protein [uncultured archaeon]|nr:Uncharacterised protein [uncultured archaeon]